MKLLGKRSLSTLLRLALDAVFYLAILAAVLLAVAVTLAGRVENATTSEEWPVSFELDPATYGMRSSEAAGVEAAIVEARGNLRVTRIGGEHALLRLAMVFPVIGCIILVAHRLRRLFRRLEQGRPFAPANASDLRVVGGAVIAAELLWAGLIFWMTGLLGAEFAAAGVTLRPVFAPRQTVLLAGVVLFIVAEVFRQGAVMKADLETAREIQFSLVPAPDFEQGPVAIHSRMEPARAVGGDYYDVVELEGGQLAFTVADVAGKGLPAALLMALLQGSLRSLLSSGLRGAELITRLNAYLVASTPGNRMITLFYAELDPATGRLCYVNAGHNPPFLRGATGVVRLGATGLVLGVMEGAEFSEGEAELAPGGLLLLYTDGVSEAANPADEEFGEARLEQLVIQRATASPPQLVEAIVAEVAGFCRDAPQADDMTIMAVARNA